MKILAGSSLFGLVWLGILIFCNIYMWRNKLFVCDLQVMR